MKTKNRFTVECRQLYESPAEALDAASKAVYISPQTRAHAESELRAGRPVTVSYGFNSVMIEPPESVLGS